jgi:hypothetical protein
MESITSGRNIVMACRTEMERERLRGFKTHLLNLACPVIDPLLGLIKGLVEGKETSLSTSLDELIRFGDELEAGLEQPLWERLLGSQGASLLIEEQLCNAGVGGSRRGTELQGSVDKRYASKPVGYQKLGVVLANG